MTRQQPSPDAALVEVRSRLVAHLHGDAPWACPQCYHSQPCINLVILQAAENWLEFQIKAKALRDQRRKPRPTRRPPRPRSRA